MARLVLILLVFCSFGFTTPDDSFYEKIYDNEHLVAEGWTFQGKKQNYWKYYYSNGNIKSEGHYNSGVAYKYWKFYHSNGTISKDGNVKNNTEFGWWHFYNKVGNQIEKTEFFKGKKHGFSQLFKNNELYQVKKYDLGKEVGSWTDYPSFMKDN